MKGARRTEKTGIMGRRERRELGELRKQELLGGNGGSNIGINIAWMKVHRKVKFAPPYIFSG